MTDEMSTTTTTRRPKTSKIKWVGIALLVVLACIATTYGILSIGNLIERTRGPTPADLARQEAELKWIVVLGGAVAC